MGSDMNQFLAHLVLENEKIKLRHFRKEDDLAIFSFLSDRESCYLDGGYEPYASYNEAYREIFSSIFVGDNTRFCIVDQKTDEVVGLLHLMEDKSRACLAIELGFGILPSFRGKGYATNAVELISDYLFETCKAELILLGTMGENKDCLRIVEKLGFEFEGRRHKACWNAWKKVYCDYLYFYRERVDEEK